MGERLGALMLLGLLVWTALGVIGLVLAKARGERARFGRGWRGLSAVWAGYAVLLAGVSRVQAGRVYRPGESRCFRTLCFAVEGADELPGFRVSGQERERLLRVHLRVTNGSRAKTESEPGLVVYLVDAQGRRWPPLPGLGGVRLATPVPARGSTVSEPVFRVGKDATGLQLVLLHDRWTFARLSVGNSESLFHRPATMQLP